MSMRIYTMTHKKFTPLPDPLYVPLHVGRACGENLGYLGDDTGEQISALNCYYRHLPLQTVSDQRKRTDLYGEGIPGTVKKIRSGHDQKSPVKQFLLRRIFGKPQYTGTGDDRKGHYREISGICGCI